MPPLTSKDREAIKSGLANPAKENFSLQFSVALQMLLQHIDEVPEDKKESLSGIVLENSGYIKQVLEEENRVNIPYKSPIKTPEDLFVALGGEVLEGELTTSGKQKKSQEIIEIEDTLYKEYNQKLSDLLLTGEESNFSLVKLLIESQDLSKVLKPLKDAEGKLLAFEKQNVLLQTMHIYKIVAQASCAYLSRNGQGGESLNHAKKTVKYFQELSFYQGPHLWDVLRKDTSKEQLSHIVKGIKKLYISSDTNDQTQKPINFPKGLPSSLCLFSDLQSLHIDGIMIEKLAICDAHGNIQPERIPQINALILENIPSILFVPTQSFISLAELSLHNISTVGDLSPLSEALPFLRRLTIKECKEALSVNPLRSSSIESLYCIQTPIKKLVFPDDKSSILLSRLFLQSCDIESLPDDIGDLPYLTSGSIEGNFIKEIPESLKFILERQKNQPMKNLNSRKGLKYDESQGRIPCDQRNHS